MAYAEDINKTIEELGGAFNEFKKTNDDRLTTLEKGDALDGLVEGKLKAINDKLSELEKLKGQFEELETKANRPGSTFGGKQQNAEYEKAFDQFVRKGKTDQIDDLKTKTMQTSNDEDGGYAVPEQLDRQIIDFGRDQVVMRSVCSSQTLSTPDLKKLRKDGRATSGWVGETSPRPNTDTSQLKPITTHWGEIYANPEATQTMLDDAFFNVQQFLLNDIGEEFSEQEEAAFTNGDGNLKPVGLFAYPRTTQSDDVREFGKLQYLDTATAKLEADDLLKLLYALKRKYRTGARWMMNSTSVGQVRLMKDNDGNYLWSPGLQAGEPSRLLGYSLTENEQVDDIAAKKAPISFGNFKRAYLILDRIGTRVLRDPYTNKPFVSFYTTKRVGNMLLDSNAVKVLQIKGG
ncbi:phage major capsid protein [Spartinivicinus marinus]|uniref:phage major capsid protein n=1 Tax=Spartinivicinus marinus TaxID=2994442 RepID=UPI0022547DBB|nr:phage major capsid protein [Spartinivicinus marinus]MCX4027931.1 phage major capsid protein [Spartinivicinus marinus]